MFAILLHPDMQPFYDNVTSFPTLFFSFFLILSILFWCVAMLGLIDIDFFEVDMPSVDMDVDIDVGTFEAGHSGHHHDLTDANILGGILLKYGLDGVPVTIIISLLSLIGWVTSFLIVHFSFGFLPFDWLHYVAGIPVFVMSLYLAIRLTAPIIKPLKPMFDKLNELPLHKQVLGQAAMVKTLKVTPTFGEAILEDGGAGLQLKIRCSEKDEGKFKKGDSVVLLEYFANANAYRVISEDEFNG